MLFWCEAWMQCTGIFIDTFGSRILLICYISWFQDSFRENTMHFLDHLIDPI